MKSHQECYLESLKYIDGITSLNSASTLFSDPIFKRRLLRLNVKNRIHFYSSIKLYIEEKKLTYLYIALQYFLGINNSTRKLVKEHEAQLSKTHEEFLEFRVYLLEIFLERKTNLNPHYKRVYTAKSFVNKDQLADFFYTIMYEWIVFHLFKNITGFESLRRITHLHKHVKGNALESLKVIFPDSPIYTVYDNLINSLNYYDTKYFTGINVDHPIFKDFASFYDLDGESNSPDVYRIVLENFDFATMLNFRMAKYESKAAASIRYLLILFLFGPDVMSDLIKGNGEMTDVRNAFNNRALNMCKKYLPL